MFLLCFLLGIWIGCAGGFFLAYLLSNRSANKSRKVHGLQAVPTIGGSITNSMLVR